MIRLSIILALLLQLSCSSIHFKSENKIRVSFEQLENHKRDIKVEVSKPFYMWGLVPKEHKLVLDDVLIKQGYESVANLEIKEINVYSKIWWSILTFGMYYPETFEISGKIQN